MTWEALGDADSYEVQISITDVTSGIVTEMKYEIPEILTIGDERYWRVRALKEGEDPDPWSEPRSFEIVPSQSPQVIGSLEVGGGGYRVTVQGDYAYLPRTDNGISIVDISDPTTPVLAGEITGIETGHGLGVQGDYLYVVDNTTTTPASLMVYDISNPSSPQLFGGPFVLTDSGRGYKASASFFTFWGNNLYFPAKRTAGTAGNNEGYLIDLTNIESPTPVSTIINEIGITTMQGNYGYGLEYDAPGVFQIMDFIPGD